nr:hypothetical protein [Tanacetum cinerariifolium]
MKFLNTLHPEWSKFVTDVKLIDYAPIAHHPSEFSSLETRLVIPIFQKGDDPIDAINHMMSFLTSVVTLGILSQTTSSEHLPTLVIKQQSMMEGLLSNQFRGGRIICRLVRRDRLHKDQEEHLEGKGKLCVITAKVRGIWLSSAPNQEEARCRMVQGQSTSSSSSSQWTDNLAEVNNHNYMPNHLIPQEMQVPSTSEQSTILAQSNTKSTSDSNIISYSMYMNVSQYNTVQNSTLPALQDDLILSVIEQLRTQVVNCTKINQDNT